MNMLYGSQRETYRRQFLAYWQDHQRGVPLDAMGQRVLGVILAHPEYHALLSDADAVLAADFPPELGQSNPFAHMALHVGLLELLALDQPTGIVQEFVRLRGHLEQSAAEHVFVDCLGELIWQAQRDGRAPNLQALLPCVRHHTGRGETEDKENQDG